ncbi:DnaA N-terminal domain-containing protein [Bradyrhizobium liaoningense]|uniref:DnaA N-terminal domain-containing protein n=1 Tax=Bradyrhizobium liaoningense TaxID=43992 RepID=UPI001BA49ABE|nr:DnaA N-terminal domain-containing protein [Bradyrhizobium liaoningense]MBR0945915.1 hypothetical protein [Bradyrhizobium liaoningense]
MTRREINARKFANVDRAAVDPRLTDFDYRLLGLMVKLARGGVVHELQKDLAQAHGKEASVRAVQRSRDRLVWFGYLVPIRKSTYSVLGRATLQSPLEDDPTVAFDETATEQGDPVVQKGDPVVQKCDPPFVHSSLSPLVSPSHTIDTESSPAPRQRADAALGAGLNGQSGLGELGERLRQRIGDAKFESWFGDGKAELVEQTADRVTLAAKSQFLASYIANNFESQILACAPGAVWLHVVVRDAKPAAETSP